MRERVIRRWHRRVALVTVVFILIQTLTGLVFIFESFFGVYVGGIVHDLHKHFGFIGDVMRLMAAGGLVLLIMTGTELWVRVFRRKHGE